MVSTDTHGVYAAVHSVLVESVKNAVRSHKYAEEVWLNFIYAHAPKDESRNIVRRDPGCYSSSFLGDYLQYLGTECKNDLAITHFYERKARRQERTERTASSFDTAAPVWIDFIWIVVGETVLRGFSGSGFNFREVALPSDLVHHSGTSVAMLLSCVASGVLAERLNVRVDSNVAYGCVHFEGKWSTWPCSIREKACIQRIDNLNKCLCAWGVDAGATRKIFWAWCTIQSAPTASTFYWSWRRRFWIPALLPYKPR